MVRSDLFNLNYYRKADFTGSKGEMCYRLSLETEAEEEHFKFEWWKGPFATAQTEEEKQTKTFPYTNEGLDEIVALIDAMETHEARGEMFKEYMINREKGELNK